MQLIKRSLRQPGFSFYQTFDHYFTGKYLVEKKFDSKLHNGYTTDWLLQNMAAIRGFDGLPTVKRVIDPETSHPVGILYRGVSNPAAIHSFKYGEYTPTIRRGSFGHGIYAACKGEFPAWWNAMSYAENDPAKILLLALRKDARVIGFEDLMRIWDEERDRLLGLYTNFHPDWVLNRVTAIKDFGRAAVYFGFDAVMFGSRRANEINILNRSVVLVQNCACADD